MLALTHLTHFGEPRGEMQARSCESSENYLSSQSQRRDARQTAQRRAALIRGTDRVPTPVSSEWQELTAETIESRKVVHTYRKKVLETPGDE